MQCTNIHIVLFFGGPSFSPYLEFPRYIRVFFVLILFLF